MVAAAVCSEVCCVGLSSSSQTSECCAAMADMSVADVGHADTSVPTGTSERDVNTAQHDLSVDIDIHQPRADDSVVASPDEDSEEGMYCSCVHCSVLCTLYLSLFFVLLQPTYHKHPSE